jgi:DNA-binding response OmpR family regulator
MPPPRSQSMGALPRLLVLDDETQIGLAIRRVAESYDYDVQTAERASAFRTAYKTFPPDAIVLDLADPDMDGIELLNWLADEGCDPPILIISGLDRTVIETARFFGEARGLKIAGTMSKPVRTAELRAMLFDLRS